ncbi:MAG TPA: fructosamine kinase family protein [Pseudonocardia sp.]|jgi:fructosamine-3-kinase|uniref:fructosamine kinase family protein n=1 Tax=Pseudonocardia sp. TaxID=60912 RepID=UPI002F413768
MSTEAAEVVRRLTGAQARSVRAGGALTRVELADGGSAVLKSSRLAGQTAAEAAGLRWLAEADAVPVAGVLGQDEEWLLLEYLPSAAPDADAAGRFGAGLARLHASGAPAFGAPPPGGPEQAWIGRAPMLNRTGPSWPAWYAEHRVQPYLRLARDAGDLDGEGADTVAAACTALVEVPELAGPPVAPARLHGDLWSGNVCWSAAPGAGRTEGWVIDPAAHGGHPETDLAMLALFGCPHLNTVLQGYQQVTALHAGWADRVQLHQLFPLLVHVVMFGRAYSDQAVAAARSVRALAQDIP